MDAVTRTNSLSSASEPERAQSTDAPRQRKNKRKSSQPRKHETLKNSIPLPPVQHDSDSDDDSRTPPVGGDLFGGFGRDPFVMVVSSDEENRDGQCHSNRSSVEPTEYGHRTKVAKKPHGRPQGAVLTASNRRNTRSPHNNSPTPPAKSPDPDDLDDDPSSLDGGGRQSGGNGRRSYKNLTRARRIIANARERSRVHTISAAFEGLRRAVPSYSYNQKLSKLAILRIACSYILALARLADMDYGDTDEETLSFADCVDLCTKTIQCEGRSRRRKVNDDI